LLALVLAGTHQLCAAPVYEVSGIVVDSRSHLPLTNARISLAPTESRERKLEQVTQQDGRFAFAVSQPGKYVLAVTKPGYPPQDYKQAGFVGASTAIVVREGQDTTSLVFEARRGSVISGLVRDEDSEPVGNALVTVYQSALMDGERRVIPRGQTRANAAGEFRLAGLPRGSYYVCAMGRPWFADFLIQLQEVQQNVTQFQFHRGMPAVPSDEQPEEAAPSPPKFSPDPNTRGTAFLTMFYPNAQSVEQASLVRVEAGDEAQVSITLPLVRAVSVKATINAPGEISDGMASLTKKVNDRYVSFLGGWVSKDKTVQFRNVPPGSYEIVASSQAGTGASSWEVREPVEVGASDLEVTLRPQPMSSLSGRVLFAGERPAAQPDLFVTVHDEEGHSMHSEVNSQGSYWLSRLPAGRYEVTAGNKDYLAAYLTGPAGERLPLTIAISSGETIQRDLTLTQAVSTIEGTVENAGAPLVGAFVLLIPKNSSERWAYRVDQTDSDGSYRLSTIPSGEYFLIALSDGEDVAYRDPKIAATLANAAKSVHVDPGDHLDLKLDPVNTAALKLPPL